MNDLKQKTFNGVIWSSIQRFTVMGVTFISNVVLARILSPEDFGCIAMLMIFIGLSNTFIDGGFGSALIQKKAPTQTDYSTIFYWNLILAVILYIVLYMGAPLVAQFYRIELLKSVLQVQGVVLILNAFCIIPQNQLRKQLQFKKLAFVNISAAFLSLVIAIVTALSGWGVWSLVVQQLSLSAMTALFLVFATRWKPLWIFSFQSFRELFKFGGFILLSNLFSSLSNEIQGLLVGRMFDARQLGLYNQARRLEGSASITGSSIIDQVTYPIMASLQDDRTKLQEALKRFIQLSAFICCPIMLFLIVAAKPIIILIYSEKWVDCAPYLQILCVAGVAVCLQGSANNAIAAVGRSDVFFRWTIIKRSLTILLCFIGIWLGGMYGLLWCTVAGTWGVFLINAYLVSKYIGYSCCHQIVDILPFMTASLVIGIIVYCLSELVSWNAYMLTSFQFTIVFALYIGTAYLFKFESLTTVVGLIKERLKK